MPTYAQDESQWGDPNATIVSEVKEMTFDAESMPMSEPMSTHLPMAESKPLSMSKSSPCHQAIREESILSLALQSQSALNPSNGSRCCKQCQSQDMILLTPEHVS